MRRVFAALVLALFLAGSAVAIDTSKLKPTGYVNDFAAALDPARRAEIEAYCANVERLTGVQFAIVLVQSLEGEPVEDVANRLYREWGVGKKGKDEGLLLLLAIADRKQRAEVGYGLEGVIPDGFSGGVLRSIRPILRQGDYASAVMAAVQQFGQHVAEEKHVDLGTGLPMTGTRRGPAPQQIPWPLILLGLFLLFSFFARGGGRGGGGGTGFITGMILGNLLGQGGRRGGGWGGGGFGGGDGGGGGFGGFGGGSSGGGGASGDW